jgi:hypothetical protein
MTADKTSFLPGGVDYLLQHQEPGGEGGVAPIDWNTFIRVPDDRVVDLAISQIADPKSPLNKTYPRCCRDSAMFWANLARNTCSKAVALVIEHMNKIRADITIDITTYDDVLIALMGNTNDNAIEWLIEEGLVDNTKPTPEPGSWMPLPIELAGIIADYDVKYKLDGGVMWADLENHALCENPHPAAIGWIKTHTANIDWKYLGRNTADEAVEMMLTSDAVDIWPGNANDTATKYTLSHIDDNNIPADLSCNSNELAISYLLQHPAAIYLDDFIEHNDERVGRIALEMLDGNFYIFANSPIDAVVEAVIECMNKTDDNSQFDRAMSNMILNGNDVAVRWMLAHAEYINLTDAQYNPDDRIVQIAIDKNENLMWMWMQHSKNVKAAHWVHTHMDVVRDFQKALPSETSFRHPLDMGANPLLFVPDETHRKFLVD